MDAIEVERIEVSAHRVPTDAPEADGTLAWDATTIVIVRAAARGCAGTGYSYTHDAARRLIERKAEGPRRGRECAGRGRPVAGDGRCGAQLRPPGHRRQRDRGGRHRALGSEGASFGSAARDHARRLPGGDRDLRQRRLHLLFQRPAAGAAGWLDRPRHRQGQDQGRQRAPRPTRRGCGRPARRSAPRPICSSMPTAPTTASRRWPTPRSSPASTASAGSRSRSPRTISRGCACSAIAPPRAWTSRPVSTATTSTISGACSRPARSTCCRPT
jgi:hypothetical protein